MLAAGLHKSSASLGKPQAEGILECASYALAGLSESRQLCGRWDPGMHLFAAEPGKSRQASCCMGYPGIEVRQLSKSRQVSASTVNPRMEIFSYEQLG